MYGFTSQTERPKPVADGPERRKGIHLQLVCNQLEIEIFDFLTKLITFYAQKYNALFRLALQTYHNPQHKTSYL